MLNCVHVQRELVPVYMHPVKKQFASTDLEISMSLHGCVGSAVVMVRESQKSCS